MARGVIAQDERKWSLVGRAHFATLGCAGKGQFAIVSHMLFNPSSQICFLVHVCVRHEPVLPLPHGRVRSNDIVKHDLCLLRLLWPGAVPHCIRSRCIRNKAILFLPLFPSIPPPNNVWNFRIILQNCVAEHLLNLGSLQAGDASADFIWGVMNSHNVNAPGVFRGVSVPWPQRVSVLFRVYVRIKRSVQGWEVGLCLFIYYLLIFTHFLNPLPEPQGIISFI